jgi:two-component system, NtrC family, response regulator AtoC
LHALNQTGGIQIKAAELLGISERSLWYRLKKLKIDLVTRASH